MEDILDKFLIPDLVDIVWEFLYAEMKEFTNEFIDECVETGNYYYILNCGKTLIHHLFHTNRRYLITGILSNSPYLDINNFQNKDEYGKTELHYLCYHKMIYSIRLVLKHTDKICMKYFQNKDEYGKTELHLLCKNKMGVIIRQITDLHIDYFLNISKEFFNGCTELWWLCANNMGDIIKLISKKFVVEDFLVTCSGMCEVEFFLLCKQNMKEIIVLITDLSLSDFNIGDSYGNPAHCYMEQSTKNYIIKHFPHLKKLNEI